jgi:hypothetical protein
MHHPCTTDITHNHLNHTLIITVREVCMRLEDIQKVTRTQVDMVETERTATKLPTMLQMFPWYKVSNKKHFITSRKLKLALTPKKVEIPTETKSKSTKNTHSKA